MQTRSKYIKQLEDLNSSIQRMSDKAAADIRAAGLALAGDAGAAEGIMQGAKAERHLRSAIEDGCLDAMLLQQPLVADDLRFVSGAFRLVSDLTHVGGMTREVAYLALSIPQETIGKIGAELSTSAEKVANMIEQATAAFLNSDEEAARQVYAADDEIDALYHKAEAAVIELIRATDSDATHLPELLMVAKYFERMGDDAQRIASWAVFRVTGVHEVYSDDAVKEPTELL